MRAETLVNSLIFLELRTVQSLIPHVLLYSKSGIMAGFYLFPFIAIACLLLAKTLSLIEKQHYFLSIAIIVLMSILLMTLLPAAWTMYARFGEDSRVMNQLLPQIEFV